MLHFFSMKFIENSRHRFVSAHIELFALTLYIRTSLTEEVITDSTRVVREMGEQNEREWPTTKGCGCRVAKEAGSLFHDILETAILMGAGLAVAEMMSRKGKSKHQMIQTAQKISFAVTAKTGCVVEYFDRSFNSMAEVEMLERMMRPEGETEK